jgi:hypothetical protein
MPISYRENLSTISIRPRCWASLCLLSTTAYSIHLESFCIYGGHLLCSIFGGMIYSVMAPIWRQGSCLWTLSSCWLTVHYHAGCQPLLTDYNSSMPRTAVDNTMVFVATICSVRFIWIRLSIIWIVRQDYSLRGAMQTSVYPRAASMWHLDSIPWTPAIAIRSW